VAHPERQRSYADMEALDLIGRPCDRCASQEDLTWSPTQNTSECYMDFVVEMPSLSSADWYARLRIAIAQSSLDVDLASLVGRGGLGAGLTAKFRAHLTTAADIATVVALAVSLHSEHSQVDRPAPTEQCSIELSTPSKTVQIQTVCPVSPTDGKFMNEITSALGQFGNEAPKIVITRMPVNGNPDAQTNSDH